MSLDLRLDVQRTQAGLYTVTYAHLEAPLDVQEAAFAARRLHLVSPAELSFLRATQPDGITTFNRHSRTSADVVYDDRNGGQVVIVLNSVVSRLVGIANVADAHRDFQEYVIPQGQRDLVYTAVDAMLGNGTAVTAHYEKTIVDTFEFGATELTSKLFSDDSLGIQAQKYGNWLQSQDQRVQLFGFDHQADASIQNIGPYINRLCVYGPVFEFGVLGGGFKDLGENYGAFGVRFEKTVKDGSGHEALR